MNRIRFALTALALFVFGIAVYSNEASAIAPEQQASRSVWHGPYGIKYTDFQNDAGVKALAVTTASKTFVEDIYVDLDTAFARASLDGGPSAVTLSLGKTSAATHYKGATTVATGASDLSSGTFRMEAAGVGINAYLVTTGTNASTLTAGAARVYLKTSEISR